MRQCLRLFLLFTTSSVTLTKQIPCAVNLEKGVKYNRITWYKVSFEFGSLVGLVMKDFRENVTLLYKNASHCYKIGDDLSLLGVPESRQEQCELYRCFVWPPVGHRILHSDYLYPEGCKIPETPRESTQVLATKMNEIGMGLNVVILSAVLILIVICICVFAFLHKRRTTYTLATQHAKC